MTQGFGGNAATYKPLGMIGHNGWDIGAPCGSQLYAPNSGKVWAANDPPGYGLYVMITGSVETVTAHMSRLDVKTGQSVTEGQPIGLSGTSGFSTGCHTHFGTRPISYNRNNGYYGYVDPSRFFKQVEPMINDADNEYARWNKLFGQIRGRAASREEFRNAAVGRSWLQAMEILSDDPEADRALADQNRGRSAEQENWLGQITDLKTRVAVLTAQVADLQAKLATVGDDTVNLNALGNLMQWLIKRLGLRKEV